MPSVREKRVVRIALPPARWQPDFCRMANERAYNLALNSASSRTRSRFGAFGQPYTFGPDLQKSGGPLFLDAGEQQRLAKPKSVMLRSPWADEKLKDTTN